MSEFTGGMIRNRKATYTDLRGAVLVHANLSGVHLNQTGFRSAILRNADLQGADLTDADFLQTNLAVTRLQCAILNGVPTFRSLRTGDF